MNGIFDVPVLRQGCDCAGSLVFVFIGPQSLTCEPLVADISASIKYVSSAMPNTFCYLFHLFHNYSNILCADC